MALVPSNQNTTYYIEFVLPTGYVFSPRYQTTYTNDSNANETTGGTDAIITPMSGLVNITIDAGLYRPASLGNYVWNDQDGNGVQDPGITPIADVNVTLFNSTGAEIATTITNRTGFYQFTDLTPGDYYVEFEAPPGFNFSPKDNGPDDSDNDANATGRTDLITLASGEHNGTIDAALFQGTALGDFVWDDLNANGIQDVGEPGIDNVTVKLYNESFVLINTTNTSAGGYYGFGPLEPNTTYYIEFVLPIGYVFSPRYQTTYTNDSNANETTGWTDAIITPTSGLVNITIDAGLYRPASLGNYVWNDQDGNGVQDPGITGIADVNVTLFNSTGVKIATTITNRTGFYQFTNLTPGDYYVVFDPPTGFNFSPKDNGPDDRDNDANATGRTDPITLASGENNDTIDAALFEGTGLGDFVWEDLNANGIQDDGEPGIENVTVNLYNESFDSINTTTTDDLGLYGFTNLPPATGYYIEFVLPDGYIVSPRYQTTYTNDSNANATGWTALITTPDSGQINNTIDAGLYREASIGDFVWFDINGDGVQDAGEPGLGNITVILLNGTGVEIATTMTNASGYYNFSGLPAGNYTVEVNTTTLPTGFAATYDLDGGLDSTTNLTLGPGQNRTDIDFGYAGTCLIGDWVWHDLNGNGINEGNGPGLDGVKMLLMWAGFDGEFGTADDINYTQETNEGVYAFTKLLPGNYTVRVDVTTLPADFIQTFDLDSVLDSTTNLTLALEGNCTRDDVDFGYTPQPGIEVPSLSVWGIILMMGLLVVFELHSILRRRM